MIISSFQIVKFYLLLAAFCVCDFFRLRGNTQKMNKSASFGTKIVISQHIDENSDDEISFKVLNSSRLSKLSADDDNNNESNVTPTLNNSIPRITPELKIINSTPLNHFNHQHEGLSSRKYRRDLTRSW